MNSVWLMHTCALCAGIGVAMLVFSGAVVVLAVPVFFHELGHLVVARILGAQVSTFSLGFGPELIGFKDRYGTCWRIAALPVGGFVRYNDEGPQLGGTGTTQAVSERGHIRRMAARRAGVVAAGPLLNLIMATLIFASIFTLHGNDTSGPREDLGRPESAAASGASHEPRSLSGTALFEPLFFGAQQTYGVGERFLECTWNFVTGKRPIMRGDQPDGRSVAILFADLLASFSVLLALLNLVPLLPLDGGRLVVCAVEAIWAVPIPNRVQHAASVAGVGLMTILPLTIAVAICLRW